eukprot:SAG11_NODE_25750_length_354_cov_1.349020_1_plen_41_part_01
MIYYYSARKSYRLLVFVPPVRVLTVTTGEPNDGDFVLNPIC